MDKVMKSGIGYKEVRRADTGETVVRFYFVTRCYSDYMQKILDELAKFHPDVIIMNSCVWDLHRYGPHGMSAFKRNLKKLMDSVEVGMGPNSTFIWTATLPVAKQCKGGFLLPYCDSIPSREVVEVNYYAQDLMKRYRHTFLDFHMVFSAQLHHRAADGIHWNNVAHRRMSHLLLQQISTLWAVPLPCRFLSWHPPIGCMLPGSLKLARDQDVKSVGAHPNVMTTSGSGSSSDEMSEEAVYRRRFNKCAHYAYIGTGQPIANTLKNVAAIKVDRALSKPFKAPASLSMRKVHFTGPTLGCGNVSAVPLAGSSSRLLGSGESVHAAAKVQLSSQASSSNQQQAAVLRSNLRPAWPAYWPKTSSNMLASTRFHPYASSQTPQWSNGSTHMSLMQRARHFALSHRPQPQVPYHELQRMIQRQIQSRYH